MPRNGEYVLAEVRERLLCFEFISNGSLGDLIPRLKIFENEGILFA
jgi:coatomer subunit beta'